MNEDIKVSVIMPAYNAEKFIAKSIESVLNQTYKNIEFVIVNDGSTDSTTDIIRWYESRNPDTILFVDKEINEGTAKTLNIAMSYASGTYMCWLSADDLYVKVCGLLQDCLDLCAVLAYDANVISSRFVHPLFLGYLAFVSAESAESVGGKQHFFFFFVAKRDFRPVHHGRGNKMQNVFA